MMPLFVVATMSGNGQPIGPEFWALCRFLAIGAFALGCVLLLLALYKRIRLRLKKAPVDTTAKHDEAKVKNLMRAKRITENLDLNAVGRKAMKRTNLKN